MKKGYLSGAMYLMKSNCINRAVYDYNITYTEDERMAKCDDARFGGNATILGTNSTMLTVKPTMFESNSSTGGLNTEAATRDPQIDLVFNIRFWVYITVIPIGILGNIVCILVVSKKQNRKASSCVYMGALAIADTVVLISQGGIIILVTWLTKIFAADKLNIMCKVFAYSLFSAAFCGTMIILALLAERVIAVTCPLKAAVLLSPRRALIVIITIIILTFTYNIPIIFSATVIDHFGLQCISVPGLGYASAIYHMSKIVLSGVLPLVAILTMNLTILCAVKSSQRQQKCLSAEQHRSMNTISSSISGNPDQRSQAISTDDVNLAIAHHQDHKISKTERQLTVMTVVLTLSFLCLTIPKYAHQLAFINIDWQSSPQMVIVFGWSGTITSELHTINSAINFFLYVMTGSKFREDLKTMFQCK